MKIIPFTALACPLDGDVLVSSGTAWSCGNGHSFDIAKKGHTHLLPVQNKHSRDPGDSKQMVAARQRFLNAGHYQPIASAVNQHVLSQGTDAQTLSCLDAGCGEGFYLRALAAEQSPLTLALLGVDISKWAVLAASKQDPQPNWVVATNAHLPVLTGSVDVVLCLFGFPVYPEFARVLKPGGLLLQADTGSDHLRELRDIIYPQQKPQKENSVDIPQGFSHSSSDSVRYSLPLHNTDTIGDLLAMTPHFYRASAEGRARVAALQSLTVSVDVTLTSLIRAEN